MQRVHGFTIPIIAFLLFLVLSAAAFVLGPKDFGRRPWRAFDLVLLEDGADLPAARGLLTAAGEQPIDRIGATVQIEDFLGGEWVSVSVLDDRFESVDPRFDPFVRALPSLFAGGGGELLYLPRQGSILSRQRAIRTILEGIPFQIVGWNPVPAIFSAACAALVMVLALRTRYVRRWPIVLGLFAVAAHALAGGPAGLVRGSLVGYAWAIYLDRQALREREYLSYGDRRGYDAGDRFVLLHLGVSILLAGLTIVGEGANLWVPAFLSWLAMLSALVVVTVGWHLINRKRLRSSEHRLFAPRPILERSFGDREHGSPLVGGAPWAMGALLIGLALVFVAGDTGGSSGDLVLPVPEHYAVEPEPGTVGVGVRALAEASRSIVPSREALSTAGFLAHRWYQEGLSYGATFTVPRYGETVDLQHFEMFDGGLRAIPEPVLVFDDRWITEQIVAGDRGVYRVIIEEGGVFVVRPGVVRMPGLDPQRTIQLLAAILISIVPLGFGLRSRGVLGTVRTVLMKEQHSA